MEIHRGTGTPHAVLCRKSQIFYGTARHVPRGTRGTLFFALFHHIFIINIRLFTKIKVNFSFK
jgi:hypothetical protein